MNKVLGPVAMIKLWNKIQSVVSSILNYRVGKYSNFIVINFYGNCYVSEKISYDRIKY